MNKKQTLKKTIIRNAISLAFCVSLCLLATISYAWFSNNSDVTANGVSLQIVADSSINVMDYYIYKRTGADEGAKAVDKSLPLSMSEYDTVFTDKNVNTPIVIKAMLDLYPTDFSPFYITINCGDDYLDDDKLVNSLSNIIKIGSMHGDATIDGYNSEDEAEDIYNYAVDNITDDDSQSFVEFTVNNSSSEPVVTLTGKETSIELEISDYESSIIDGILCVYFKIDYEDKLVLKYLDDHEIDVETSGDSDEITFNSDITSFTFAIDEMEDDA